MKLYGKDISEAQVKALLGVDPKDGFVEPSMVQLPREWVTHANRRWYLSEEGKKARERLADAMRLSVRTVFHWRQVLVALEFFDGNEEAALALTNVAAAAGRGPAEVVGAVEEMLEGNPNG